MGQRHIGERLPHPAHVQRHVRYGKRRAPDNRRKGISAYWPFVVDERRGATFASNFKEIAYREREDIKTGWTRILNAGGHTTAVGTYARSPAGCFDMSGNAFEWTRDYSTVSSYLKAAGKSVARCLEDVTSLTEEDRVGFRWAQGKPTKVIRGGSWYANQGSCMTHRSSETRVPGRAGFHSVGFRFVALV
jgi:formylglycine-generating enzyme required for sulfatase activity